MEPAGEKALREDGLVEVKAGRALSAANLAAIQAAFDALANVLKRVGALEVGGKSDVEPETSATNDALPEAREAPVEAITPVRAVETVPAGEAPQHVGEATTPDLIDGAKALPLTETEILSARRLRLAL